MEAAQGSDGPRVTNIIPEVLITEYGKCHTVLWVCRNPPKDAETNPGENGMLPNGSFCSSLNPKVSITIFLVQWVMQWRKGDGLRRTVG